MKHALPLTLVSIAGLLVASQSLGALRLLASDTDSDFDVVTNNGATRSGSFPGLAEPVIGIGITAGYTTVAGDFGDGLGPWSLDVTMRATAPGGEVSGVFNPISGDVTIADYPLQDGSAEYGSPVGGDGSWAFDFGSTDARTGWTYGLRGVSYHLFGDAPDVVWMDSVTPVLGQEWDRPFFIEGVSGLGPVDYHAMAFTVDVSGVYDFSSVLASGNNHFTFIYRDAFDPALPLDNLMDYGLGNGFGHNGDPAGTSSFGALLHAGSTYYWITSQWAASSPNEAADNTIVGPGNIVLLAPCESDLNGDGVVDTADLGILISLFGSADALADVNDDGVVDTADLGILIGEFGAACL